jgi:hypothetical protein
VSRLHRTDAGWLFQYGRQWRKLKEPHGPATPAQLARLNREGRLLVAPPGRGRTLSKLDAARLIDDEAAAP